MPQGINVLVYPVTDLAHAKAVYSALLGVEPYADQPYYVGFRVGGHELGLDPNGHKQGMPGPIAFWEVSDIRKSLEQLVGAGAQIVQDVRDVGGGRQTATVKDADGNVTGLVQSPEGA